MREIRLQIGGMTCTNCQDRIELGLKRTEGVADAAVSFAEGSAVVRFDETALSEEDIAAVIEGLDYEVLEEVSAASVWGNRLSLLVIIAALYVLLQRFGLLNRLVPDRLAESGMGYGMLFVVGLFTSVHCIAMCGGINLSQCIPQVRGGTDGEKGAAAFLPALLYNLGRVVSYTAIGFVLGLISFAAGGGAQTGISAFVQGILKMATGVFMVLMGLSMLNIIPGLRRLTPHLPKRLTRRIGQEKRRARQPFLVGLLNGLMPCGPLQSMWIVAFGTGSPLAGALSMLLFALGTTPLMLGLGSLVAALGKRFARGVMLAGAVLVTVLGLAMFTQGSNLSGMLPSRLLPGTRTAGTYTARQEDGVQVVETTLQSGSYPDLHVKAGVPVRWVIQAPEGSLNGCNSVILLRAYGQQIALDYGETVIEFTPDAAGTVRYSCWMGMIQGNIYVEE